MAAPRLNCTVWAILGLFALIYFTAVTCVIIPWLSYSVPGVLNLGVLSIDTGVALVCYLLCVFTDPGRVPDDYAPDSEAGRVMMEVKRKSGAVRFCQKCERHKPPRSHHCRLCRRCVLRMCHHCPWINNCVGHGNYKAFLLFLLYVNAAVFHSLGLFISHAVYVVGMHSERRAHSLKTGPGARAPGQATVLWAVLQTICTALSLPLAIGLGMLLAWNGYLVWNNKTTIEYHEGVTARVAASKAGHAYRHPYDVGVCGNLAAICGPRPHLWLCPTRAAAAGDGLAWPSAWDEREPERLLSGL